MHLHRGLVPFFVSAALMFFCHTATGQGIAINPLGIPPDSSAMLDLSSGSKGLLIPRLTAAQRQQIVLPAKALLIFNTESNCFEVNTGTPASPQWSRLITLNSLDSLGGITWKTGGNVIAGEEAVLGTLNSAALAITTNHVMRLYIDSATARIGINTRKPAASLHIATTDALLLPSGTTQQRPVTPVPGMIRFNAETGKLEGYTTEGWKPLQ